MPTRQTEPRLQPRSLLGRYRRPHKLSYPGTDQIRCLSRDSWDTQPSSRLDFNSRLSEGCGARYFTGRPGSRWTFCIDLLQLVRSLFCMTHPCDLGRFPFRDDFTQIASSLINPIFINGLDGAAIGKSLNLESPTRDWSEFGWASDE